MKIQKISVTPLLPTKYLRIFVYIDGYRYVPAALFQSVPEWALYRCSRFPERRFHGPSGGMEVYFNPVNAPNGIKLPDILNIARFDK